MEDSGVCFVASRRVVVAINSGRWRRHWTALVIIYLVVATVALVNLWWNLLPKSAITGVCGNLFGNQFRCSKFRCR